MIDKDNTKYKKNASEYETVHGIVHRCCKTILPISSEVLELLLHKSGDISRKELAQKFPKLWGPFSILGEAVEELLCTLDGKPYYLPDALRTHGDLNAAIRSIAVPIFMEEAQMMLQNQATPHHVTSNHLQQQQVAAPSPEQSQCAAPHSEIHDNSAMHYSDSDSID
ncbi:hypothetical protein Fsol_00367 [Candidatus Fokinia solitaria]|uniref:Uncharacterized protein n=1 Tax=Candidatus Fokinia solitaria TaxID=1802984 RepID=A0A2U8BS79_9RICK|nr:hypothetical protein [Candidatus Fokinia solitaria]AWD33165.1 hypothetical protein Fsol_00367 [Candidatus Fokinia solitaria]